MSGDGSTRPAGRTAFVLAGGGSLGAVQVGMLYALLESGVRPDLVYGSSVGALNGAHLAGHPDLDGVDYLARLWGELRRRDVFPMSAAGLVLALLGRRDHLVDPLGLRTWIGRARVGFDRIERAPVPLRFMATDLASGEAVVLSDGDAVDALMASAAIPGIFPPVRIGGRLLIDGGIASDAPVVQPVDEGATRVFLLPTVGPGDGEPPPRSVIDVVFRAMNVMTRKVTADSIAEAAARAELFVLPSPAGPGHSVFDFKSTRRLMDDAYDLASGWVGEAAPLSPGEAVAATGALASP